MQAAEYSISEAAANKLLASSTYQRLLLGVCVKSSLYLLVFALVGAGCCGRGRGRGACTPGAEPRRRAAPSYGSFEPMPTRRIPGGRQACRNRPGRQLLGVSSCSGRRAQLPASCSPVPVTPCNQLHPHHTRTQASSAWTPIVSVLYPVAGGASLAAAIATLSSATAPQGGIRAALPELMRTRPPKSVAGWVYTAFIGLYALTGEEVEDRTWPGPASRVGPPACDQIGGGGRPTLRPHRACQRRRLPRPPPQRPRRAAVLVPPPPPPSPTLTGALGPLALHPAMPCWAPCTLRPARLP